MNSIWTMISAVGSFALAWGLGKFLVPFLRKLKYGQTILDIGPKWHKTKQGTPTMGGLIFIISSIVVTGIILLVFNLIYLNADLSSIEKGVTTYSLNTIRVVQGLFMAVGFGTIGFIDDYIKVVKKRNLGLTSLQKLVLQFLVAGGFLFSLYLTGGNSATIIPFVGTVDIGFMYWILSAILIVGVVNAVNLSDGIDGLVGSMTFFCGLIFMLISTLLASFGTSIMAAAIAGSCLGFLMWNFFPAKVFMGDTGSLYLGGYICALAFCINMPIIIIPIGLVYLLEMLSVILQVCYFKITKGKRLFKMSPIHHHFEMCGWSEIKIVSVFSIVTVITGIIALLCVTFGVLG